MIVGLDLLYLHYVFPLKPDFPRVLYMYNFKGAHNYILWLHKPLIMLWFTYVIAMWLPHNSFVVAYVISSSCSFISFTAKS